MSAAKDAHGVYTDTTDVHLTLDLLGNPTAIVAQYEGDTTRVSQLATTDVFDLLGRSLRHVRRDAQTLNPITDQAEGGTTWQLPAADGHPARNWDSRDHATHLTYDALRRPTATFVRTGTDPETCPLFTRYGEQAEPDPADAQARRLFGQPWRIYDVPVQPPLLAAGPAPGDLHARRSAPCRNTPQPPSVTASSPSFVRQG